jgi:hypothetical protein
MNIIANTSDLNNAHETWFLQNVLFSGASINIGFNPELYFETTVIYLEMNKLSTELIEILKKQNNKIVLYHMGDEFSRINRDLYRFCDVVVRNYYFQSIFEENPSLIWAPGGFKTGVGPRSPSQLKRANERQSLSSFLGWINNSDSYNNERASFVAPAAACGQNLYVMPSNGFAGGYNIGLYSAIMEDSVFAPCPAGNAPETIRLYDALELGCIPISLSHEFLLSEDALASIGPVPFPILGSWAELPQFLEDMKAKAFSNPSEIIELQQRCIDWWSNFKLAIQRKISDRIAGL